VLLGVDLVGRLQTIQALLLRLHRCAQPDPIIGVFAGWFAAGLSIFHEPAAYFSALMASMAWQERIIFLAAVQGVEYLGTYIELAQPFGWGKRPARLFATI